VIYMGKNVSPAKGRFARYVNLFSNGLRLRAQDAAFQQMLAKGGILRRHGNFLLCEIVARPKRLRKETEVERCEIVPTQRHADLQIGVACA
jgi:hypothetical protein